MRKLLLSTAFIAALVGFSQIVCADLGSSGFKSPNFNVSMSKDQPANMLNFQVDSYRTEDTTINCTMNPMGAAGSETILEQPIQPLPDDYYFSDSPVAGFVSSMVPDRPYTPEPPYRRPPDDPTPTPLVPEPTAMLIVGLGIAGLLPVVRRCRKESKPE